MSASTRLRTLLSLFKHSWKNFITTPSYHPISYYYNHKKKYRLTKWGILCLPKEQGGLGIINLEVHNICLLSKWIFKIINEDEVWQELLRKKYLKNNTIGEVR
jgi:hypothetical protein